MMSFFPTRVAICLLTLLASNSYGCNAMLRPSRYVDHPEIRQVLDRQVEAWNRGDIDGFMAYYWNSDELEFQSPSGTTRGWRATMDRYKKGYPTREKMGTLTFDDLAINPTAPDAADVSGRFLLKRTGGDKQGRFFLNMRRIDGHWVIVRDHTVDG